MLLARSVCVFLFVFTEKCLLVSSAEAVRETFKECIISQASPSLGQCLGIEAISKLHSFDRSPEFDIVDGVTLIRNSQEYREADDTDGDPSSFRGILDTFNEVFSKRNVRWDMNYLYPGLEMRVVPSIAPGGTLEFALDTHREAVNAHSLKEFSTGRILARQFLVPFLLGFKFNVVSIIPILFGLLALLAKKAVIISKIALIVASAFGLGTLLLGNINNVQQQYQSHPFNPGFGGHGYKYQGDEYQEVYYRTPVPTQTDQLRLYDNIPVTYNRREELTKGRNFAWSEDEKVKNKIVHENR